ncbi:hypothetical protein G6F57_014067 [Rhizopus arrhizus]|uniref:Uncharacterized protein n=1 Tax=Rhizopus oryzae TaxID=64495 RepID=A0A9P6WYP8_RHIOR|nr:hypothetical protein G6F23_011417 [Rhizopus arrhizus]KAG1414652.1 hypothetical protein G6F58_006842 [Rhizopus delemar]KAG0755202.1 hypothetical protein G6F24_011987 [Rhizopus arrhizus]KAG0778294.1 hypothetical protein G6F22_011316 [Rhizopus arrhizus]KAG0781247.1 hypothetical protein G6F21_011741 [Rhizopus arrhizus]
MVFCIDKLSPSTLIAKFIPVDGKPWMQHIMCCGFWAKNCYLVSKPSISCEEVDANVSSLQALSMFLIEQSPTLYGHSHPEHSTVRMLYRLAMECTEFETQQREDLVRVVDVICTNNEKLWKKVGASIANVPGTLEAKKIISRALEFNCSAKRKYLDEEDSDSSLEPLPSCSHKKTTAEDSDKHDDLEFIMSFRKNLIGRMNWLKVFDSSIAIQSKNEFTPDIKYAAYPLQVAYHLGFE